MCEYIRDEIPLDLTWLNDAHNEVGVKTAIYIYDSSEITDCALAERGVYYKVWSFITFIWCKIVRSVSNVVINKPEISVNSLSLTNIF